MNPPGPDEPIQPEPTSQDYAGALDRLASAARAANRVRILDCFANEPERLQRLTVQAAGLYVDLSRHRLPLAAFDTLAQMVETSQLADWRARMFGGEVINTTESRAVFHVALRALPGRRMRLGADGPQVADEIAETLQRMSAFSDAVRSGQWSGATGRRITDVVNVGIGGSQLGPLLACEALQGFADPGLRVHFLANIDPSAWSRIRAQLDPDSTLVIIASKTFRTVETARNAEAVRAWLRHAGIDDAGLGRHLVGVTANPQGAREFGLDDAGIFPFRDWVGGRYSLWSAIGLPVMLRVGPANFERLLAGARAMDTHFETEPWERNAPVLMALLTLWNAYALGSQTEAVIPYCSALARLPAYLQQLQMESNGKSVDRDGRPLAAPASPVIWGEPGTDAQHSFFQALHQGPQVQPVDFILVREVERDAQGRGTGLLANALAQSEALLLGEASPENPHRQYEGNRPSSTILMDSLTPESLGALIALYEHKTASLGWLLRINSFDQWGVELGKRIATRHEALLGDAQARARAELDPSTRALLDRLAPR